MKIPKSIATQIFKFNLGISALQLFNFALVIIAASPTLSTLIHVPVKVMVIVAVPGAIFAVWLYGHLLDKVKYQEAMFDAQNERNPMMIEVRDAVKKPDKS